MLATRLPYLLRQLRNAALKGANISIPKQCLLCAQVILTESADHLCPHCRLALPFNPNPCRHCALPLASSEERASICAQCLTKPLANRAVAPLVHRQGAAFFGTSNEILSSRARGQGPCNHDGDADPAYRNVPATQRTSSRANRLHNRRPTHIQSKCTVGLASGKDVQYRLCTQAADASERARSAFAIARPAAGVNRFRLPSKRCKSRWQACCDC